MTPITNAELRQFLDETMTVVHRICERGSTSHDDTEASAMRKIAAAVVAMQYEVNEALYTIGSTLTPPTPR